MLIPTFVGSLIAGALTLFSLHLSDVGADTVYSYDELLSDQIIKNFDANERLSMGNWMVNSSKEICILAYASMELEIRYETIDTSNRYSGIESDSLNIEPWAQVITETSTCGKEIQVLSLISADTVLGLTFRKKADFVVLESVKVTYSLSRVAFPNVKDPGIYTASTHDLNELQAYLGFSYLSNTTQEIVISPNVTLVINSILVQAFRNSTDTAFGPWQNTFIPVSPINKWVLAVGVMALSIVIIVVAYGLYRICRCNKICNRHRSAYEQIV